MKCCLRSLCAMVVALIGAHSAFAAAISPSPTLISGAFTFTDFTCDFTTALNGGSVAGGCSSIDVTALTPPLPGIQFSTATTNSGIANADLALTFHVSGGAVNQVGLNFTPSVLGMEVVSVSEDVFASQGGPVLANLQVLCGNSTNSGVGCSTSQLSQSLSLPGFYSSLYITKDIILSGTSSTAFGSPSIVQQTFVSTPEPATLGLFGGGLALFGYLGLRRRK